MKTNKILAVALSAGLVLGGASVAHAGGSSSGSDAGGDGKVTLDQWIENEEIREKAIEEAKAELKEAGIENEKILAQLEEGKSPYEVDQIKNTLLKEFKDSHVTTEEYEKQQKEEEEKEKEKAEAKAKAVEEAKAELKEAGLQNEKVLAQLEEGETPYDVFQIKDRLLKEFKKGHTTIDEFNLKNAKEEAIKELKEKGITSDFFLNQIRKAKTIEGVEALKNEILKSHEASKPEDKPEKPEDKPEKPEKPEEKPDKPWLPLVPADPVPGPGYPNPVPGESDGPILGGDDKVVLPEEKPKDNKGTEIEKENPKEGKDKEEKAKPSKDKEEAKPAKQKGNNPKTGLVGLAPIYSTLAISMAGIVAARKKND